MIHSGWLKSLFFFLFALNFAFAGKCQQGLKYADSLYNILNTRGIQNFSKAVKSCNQLIQIYKSEKENCKTINSLLLKSYCQAQQAKIVESSATLILADRMFQRGECDSSLLANFYYSKGILGKYKADKKAHAFNINKGIEVWKRHPGDSVILYKLYQAAGGIGSDMKAGLANYQLALTIAKNHKLPYLEILAINNIGYVYAVNDMFEKASSYFKQALPVAKRLNAYRESGMLYNNLAGLTTDMSQQGMYIDSAVKYAAFSGIISDLQKYKVNRSFFLKRVGKMDAAYDELLSSSELKDSILSEKNIEAVADMQERYEAQKNANAIQKLTSTKLEQELNAIRYKRNQGRLLVGIFVILAILAVLIFSFIVLRKNRNKLFAKNIELDQARIASDKLLLNILPFEVAEELKEFGSTAAKHFSEVTVLFTDFKDFTSISEELGAQELVNEINYCYSEFDNIITKYGIEKIKTIGDSYMCAGGLPVSSQSHAIDVVSAALEIRDFMLREKLKYEALGKPFFEIRIGCHTGPVVAGIVGIKKFAYDIWGDTVNIASRMESTGVAGKVNVSGTTYALISTKFHCQERGKIEARNKGMIDMYFVDNAK